MALLANTLATGAALVALILTFGPISGAHFNPAVTLADASQGGLPWREVPGYLAVQVVGAFAGVAAAHVMFEQPLFFASRHVAPGARPGVQRVRRDVRAPGGDLGLRAAALGGGAVRRGRVHHGGLLVHRLDVVRQSRGDARAGRISDTFAGIRPADAPGFIVAQLLGAAAATALFRWLVPALPKSAADVVLPAR